MADQQQPTRTFSLLGVNTFLSALVCILLGTQLTLERARADTGLRSIPVPTPTVEVLPSVRLERVTYYNAVEAQTDDDPFTSACGPNRERQVAVSRDLFKSTLHCGDVIELWIDEGYMGEFVVWDTMHPRFKNTLDILTEGSYAWGKTTGHLVVKEEK